MFRFSKKSSKLAFTKLEVDFHNLLPERIPSNPGDLHCAYSEYFEIHANDRAILANWKNESEKSKSELLFRLFLYTMVESTFEHSAEGIWGLLDSKDNSYREYIPDIKKCLRNIYRAFIDPSHHYYEPKQLSRALQAINWLNLIANNLTPQACATLSNLAQKFTDYFNMNSERQTRDYLDNAILDINPYGIDGFKTINLLDNIEQFRRSTSSLEFSFGFEELLKKNRTIAIYLAGLAPYFLPLPYGIQKPLIIFSPSVFPLRDILPIVQAFSTNPYCDFLNQHPPLKRDQISFQAALATETFPYDQLLRPIMRESQNRISKLLQGAETLEGSLDIILHDSAGIAVGEVHSNPRQIQFLTRMMPILGKKRAFIFSERFDKRDKEALADYFNHDSMELPSKLKMTAFFKDQKYLSESTDFDYIEKFFSNKIDGPTNKFLKSAKENQVLVIPIENKETAPLDIYDSEIAVHWVEQRTVAYNYAAAMQIIKYVTEHDPDLRRPIVIWVGLGHIHPGIRHSRPITTDDIDTGKHGGGIGKPFPDEVLNRIAIPGIVQYLNAEIARRPTWKDKYPNGIISIKGYPSKHPEYEPTRQVNSAGVRIHLPKPDRIGPPPTQTNEENQFTALARFKKYCF